MPENDPPEGQPPSAPLDEGSRIRGEGAATPSIAELSGSVLEDDLEDAAKLGSGDPKAVVGTVLSGRYRVHELVGQGGMGAVYRGEQIHLRKRVAIKLLRPKSEHLAELVARFEREAVAGAHVQHPNVAAASDFGQLEDQSYFLVTEYVEGTALSELLDTSAPLHVARALRIARQIASALEAIHAKNIIHRDIKPANILIDAKDGIKLIDFGLAKIRLDLLPESSRVPTHPDPVLTVAGAVFGTLAYIPPEASLGMDAVDARGDLYAFGIVLYEMLSGRHPFDSTEAVSLFRHQRLEDPPPIRLRAPEVPIPASVEKIVMRLIQRNPEHRYASATEVLAAIDAALKEVELAEAALLASMESSLPSEAVAPRQRHSPPPPSEGGAESPHAAKRAGWSVPRWVLYATAVTSLAVGVALAFVFIQRQSAAARRAAAASAALSASAAAPRSSGAAASSAQAIDAEALVWRSRMRKACSIKDWALGAQAFIALARLDPKFVSDPQLHVDVVQAVAGIGFEQKSEAADQVFDLLTNGLGAAGLDVLFELARGRSATRAGHRANDILAKPEVIARATPALRVTYSLFAAECEGKRALFDRAVAEGDRRTLVELEATRAAPCPNKQEGCCYRNDKPLAEAIATLKARLGN